VQKLLLEIKSLPSFEVSPWTDQVKKILRHLIKIGRPPPGLDPASLK